MSSSVFELKRGDTSPALKCALTPTTVDLTNATVRFRMRPFGRETVVDAPAEVLVETGTPTVQYLWHDGDTDVAGVYQAEFEVTYPNGARETFPNGRGQFIIVVVAEDIPPKP